MGTFYHKKQQVSMKIVMRYSGDTVINDNGTITGDW